MAIKLGTVVTDTITGFKGVALSRTEFLHGCVRIDVQPTELVDGKIGEAVFLDEVRLKENDPKTTPPQSPLLGTYGTDSISGYKGVVTARTEYLNAGPRLTLQAKDLHEGRPVESIGIDEPQLKEYKTPKVGGYVNKKGGPNRIAPPSRMPTR